MCTVLGRTSKNITNLFEQNLVENEFKNCAMEQYHKRQLILNGIGCFLKTDHAKTFISRK